MSDKRTIDQLSIHELEHLIQQRKLIKKSRQIQRMVETGRVLNTQLHHKLDAIKTNPTMISEHDNPSSKNMKLMGSQKRIMNFFILFCEILLVLLLLFIGLQFYNEINVLQQQTSETQRIAEAKQREFIPTLQPTPQLSLTNVVLPTGHTPPNQVGGGQFNFEEIPVQMRSLIANEIFLPADIERPLPTNETPLVLRIPKLNIDHTIVQGVDWEALKLGIGQVQNDATPSDIDANVVLAAHNDIYGELFRHLDQLLPGDMFQIQTANNLYTYTITGWDIYVPTDIEVMEKRGNATATLISCYPYRVNDKRIVVFADQNIDLN